MRVDGLIKIFNAVGHHLTQITQGENPQRRFVFVNDHDAAHLLLMHQAHGFAQGGLRAAGDRVAHGQFAQAGVERVLGAQGFDGFLLHLPVDLVEQAADPAQGEIAELFGQGKHFDKRGFVQLQAEGVFSGQVFCAGGPLTQQGGEGEALASGDFKGGFDHAGALVRALADDAALFDDIEMLDRAVFGPNDAVTGAIEAQLALFNQEGQVSVFHLVKGREPLQELHGAVDVLQHRRSTCLEKRIRFAHYRYRMISRCCYHGAWPLLAFMLGCLHAGAHWT